MSDTPRTDEAVDYASNFHPDCEVVNVEVAIDLERDLAGASELLLQWRELLIKCLSIMPVGYVPTHTVENLPEMIGDLAKALAEETTEREKLERELAEAREQRETLAEALKLCEKHLEKHGHEKCDEELDETGWWLLCDVRTALVALKGGYND